MPAKLASADLVSLPCPNCGAVVERACCPECGQHRRAGERLVVKDVLLRFVEHLWDFDTAFLRTGLGLTVRPGLVCREYVRGRRKFYMNPFGYFLLAMTAALLVESMAGYFRPGAIDAEESIITSPVLWLVLLVPWSLIWRRLFGTSGYNLAETYVFMLLIVGQMIWFETAFVTPLVVAGFPAAAFWLLGAMLLIYPVWVAIGLYQEPRWKIVLKTLLSMGLISLVLVAAIIGLIEIGILPDG